VIIIFNLYYKNIKKFAAMLRDRSSTKKFRQKKPVKTFTGFSLITEVTQKHLLHIKDPELSFPRTCLAVGRSGNPFFLLFLHRGCPPIFVPYGILMFYLINSISSNFFGERKEGVARLEFTKVISLKILMVHYD